jgi:hypothetical protein
LLGANSFVLRQIPARLDNLDKNTTQEEYKTSLNRVKPLVEAFERKYGEPGASTISARPDIREIGQGYSYYFISKSFDEYEFGSRLWEKDVKITTLMQEILEDASLGDFSSRWIEWHKALKMIVLGKIILDRPCAGSNPKTREI